MYFFIYHYYSYHYMCIIIFIFLLYNWINFATYNTYVGVYPHVRMRMLRYNFTSWL